MLRLPSSILKQLFCLFVVSACLAQSPAPSTKLPAAAPDADVDSPDIPPFARGHISEQQYLELRDQQLRLQRGVNELMLDPTARSRAINQMQLQELMRKMRPSLNSTFPALVPNFAWKALGPDPIPNGQTDPNFIPANELPVSGRVTAIAVDPANENIVYVGAAQGGLYRSMDGGATWTALMDSAQSLAIGTITIDPTDHNTLFVGTGEGNLSLDSFFGVGLYIIQNATTTPTLSGPFNLDGTGTDVFTGRAITQIIVNPTDHNKILVSSSSGFSGASGDVFNKLPTRGVYLSTNALSGNPTFTRQTIQLAVANRAVTDIAMDPGNPSTVVVGVLGAFAAGDGGIWVSTAGDPWSGTATWKQTNMVNFGNVKFGVNRSGSPASTTFYAMIDETTNCASPPTSTSEGALTKSIDGGMTWTFLPAATGFCNGQCFYDMTMATDSTSGNIFVGGSAESGIACDSHILTKSTDGGVTFNPSQNFLHADSHATVIAPSNHSVIYAGNDGGIFRSNDGGSTWQSINTAGFNATQFESLSLHPTDPNFMIGGTQDNGTEFMKPDGTWTRADFGDGGFSAIDQSSTDTTNVTMYHTYFNASAFLVGFARVTNVANATEAKWSFLGCENVSNNGINCGESVLFYAPLALGPGTPNTIYFGTDHLYRSIDSGVTMTPASQVFAAGNPVSAIGISSQDDNVRLAGLVNGQVFATTSGATPMTDVSGGWTKLYVARTVIDPNNKSTAYVTLDGYGTPNHVWKTTNLTGTPPTATWASASSGLPDVPVNAFAVDPLNSSYLYAGTDIGVFLSTDGGNTWNPFGTGLPRVAVFDLNIQSPSRKVRIGTHGRGAWEVITSPFSNTTTVTSLPTPVFFGNSVILTAQINQGGGVKVPTGTISFVDGTTSLGSAVPVDGTGKATLPAGVLAQGSHNITALYSGDSLYFGSTSAALALTVQAPDYTITIPNGTATVAAGNSASYTVTISPEGSFTSAVNFNCSGLPQAATCSFTPGTVTPSGAPANSTLMISTTARMTQSAGIPSGLLTGAGFFGLVLVGGLTSRKTRRKAFLMTLSLLALAMTLISCGGGHSTITTGTPAGTFSVTITATSGNTSHQGTVTLTVQ